MKVSLVTSLCLLLAGCGSNPLERKQNEDRVTSAAVGGGLGAALGCAAAYLEELAKHGKVRAELARERCKKNALIMGAGGIVAGVALGEVAAQRRAEFETDTAKADSDGANRRAQLQQVKSELQEAERRVTQQQTELQSLQAQNRSGKVATDDVRAYLDKVSAQLADGKRSEEEFTRYGADVQAKIKVLQSSPAATSRADRAKNAEQIKDLRAEYAELTSIVRTLTGINGRLQSQTAQAQLLAARKV